MRLIATLVALMALSSMAHADIQRECYQPLFAYGSSPTTYATDCDAPHMVTFRVGGQCVAGQEYMCNNEDVALINNSLVEVWAHWAFSGLGVNLDFDVAYMENQKSNGGVRAAIGKSYLPTSGPNEHTLGVTEAWWTELQADNWESKHDLIALEYARMVLKEIMGRDKYRSIVLNPDGTDNVVGKAYFEGMALTFASTPASIANPTEAVRKKHRGMDAQWLNFTYPVTQEDYDDAIAAGRYMEAAGRTASFWYYLNRELDFNHPEVSTNLLEDLFLESIENVGVDEGTAGVFDETDFHWSVEVAVEDQDSLVREAARKAAQRASNRAKIWNMKRLPLSRKTLPTPVITVETGDICADWFGGVGNYEGTGTAYKVSWSEVPGATEYQYSWQEIGFGGPYPVRSGFTEETHIRYIQAKSFIVGLRIWVKAYRIDSGTFAWSEAGPFELFNQCTE